VESVSDSKAVLRLLVKQPQETLVLA